VSVGRNAHPCVPLQRRYLHAALIGGV
jgi:hypothetical protein